MRVGVMLRHLHQHQSGVKVYTRELLPRLLVLGQQHQFVLMYRTPTALGSYSGYPNVKEVAVRIPGKISWDQIAVPWIARRERLSLIFNPKFTVPFVSEVPTMFVLHGSEWFEIPEHTRWYGHLYNQVFAPLYCRHADAFIAVSHAVKRDVLKRVDVNPDKIRVIHNGFDPAVFRVLEDRRQLSAVRERYRLPERFILWTGQIESRKNIARLLQAFARLNDQIPHHLVLAGEQRWNAPGELRLIDELHLANLVHMTGWIPHADLAVVYNLADLFVFPSIHEGFGIPLLEAMACGCPIVAANTCAPPEIVANAGVLVDPGSVDAIAAAMREVLLNAELRETLKARGLVRCQDFGWDKCAAEVLETFEHLAGQVHVRGQGSARVA